MRSKEEHALVEGGVVTGKRSRVFPQLREKKEEKRENSSPQLLMGAPSLCKVRSSRASGRALLKKKESGER